MLKMIRGVLNFIGRNVKYEFQYNCLLLAKKEKKKKVKLSRVIISLLDLGGNRDDYWHFRRCRYGNITKIVLFYVVYSVISINGAGRVPGKRTKTKKKKKNESSVGSVQI